MFGLLTAKQRVRDVEGIEKTDSAIAASVALVLVSSQIGCCAPRI